LAALGTVGAEDGGDLRPAGFDGLHVHLDFQEIGDEPDNAPQFFVPFSGGGIQ
jgi:hypothetical protein